MRRSNANGVYQELSAAILLGRHGTE